jgi:hypothetical protein
MISWLIAIGVVLALVVVLKLVLGIGPRTKDSNPQARHARGVDHPTATDEARNELYTQGTALPMHDHSFDKPR